MNKIFNDKQINFMIKNYKTMKYREIANVLGFSERQIRGKINGLGLSKLREFNKEYFLNIDSPIKSYFLGFIFADGYIVNNELGIELKRNDEYILEKLNFELGNVHNIKHKEGFKKFNGYEYYTISSVLRVYSKDITDQLKSYGILQNKTYHRKYPKIKKYFFDFLRGFIDGDGCYYVNKKNILNIQITNSNLDFLEYLREEISQILNVFGKIYKEKENKYRLIYYRDKDSKVLLDEIYKDKKCFKLERKFDIYKKHFGPTE